MPTTFGVILSGISQTKPSLSPLLPRSRPASVCIPPPNPSRSLGCPLDHFHHLPLLRKQLLLCRSLLHVGSSVAELCLSEADFNHFRFEFSTFSMGLRWPRAWLAPLVVHSRACWHRHPPAPIRSKYSWRSVSSKLARNGRLWVDTGA